MARDDPNSCYDLALLAGLYGFFDSMLVVIRKLSIRREVNADRKIILCGSIVARKDVETLQVAIEGGIYAGVEVPKGRINAIVRNVFLPKSIAALMTQTNI